VTRLSAERLDSELRAAGVPPPSRRRDRLPPVFFVDQFDRSVVAGRYFPSRDAILVAVHERPGVTNALVNHELAHALQYRRRCGGTRATDRKKCGYVGQHDRQFYADLERLHREGGVSLRDAVHVERESGYAYPRSWSAAARRGEKWL